MRTAYFKCLVCSIFFNKNHHRNSYHVIRRFSHSVTNRFAHSTMNYRYQFKFLRCSLMLPCKSFTRNTTIPIALYPLQLDFAPIYCFPSILLRKNHVEMALNYTNSIEIRHLANSATFKLMLAII